MWKTAFEKFEGIWSAQADHIPSIFLKAVFHRLYLVRSWIYCPKSNRTYSGFSFRPVNYEEVLTEFKNLDTLKTTQLEGINENIVKENLNVFATFLVKDINTCIKNGEFLITGNG